MYKIYKVLARCTARTQITQSQNVRNDENDFLDTNKEDVLKVGQCVHFSSKQSSDSGLSEKFKHKKQNDGFHDFSFDSNMYSKLCYWNDLFVGSFAVFGVTRLFKAHFQERSIGNQTKHSYCVWKYLKDKALYERINEFCLSVGSITNLSINHALPKLKHTVKAAGEHDSASCSSTLQDFQVLKTTGLDFDTENHLKTLKKKTVTIDPKFVSEEEESQQTGSSSSSPAFSIDPEDLDEFYLASQHCIGQTFNIKGLNEFKEGKYNQAVESFACGSEEGFSSAQYNLGFCYETGKGTGRDINKAKAEYKKASLQGHKWAQYNLALLHLNEEGNSSQMHGLFLLEMAAGQGMVEAQSLLGSHLAQPGEYHNMSKAVEMFTMAAEQEDTLSIYHLAECYEHGLGGLKVDPTQACQLYSKAAKQGHLDAQFKLASILFVGCEGVPKDECRALKLLKDGSDRGHLQSSEKYSAAMRQIRVQKLRSAAKREDNKPGINPSSSAILKILMSDLNDCYSFSHQLTLDPAPSPYLYHSASMAPGLPKVTTWPRSLADRK